MGILLDNDIERARMYTLAERMLLAIHELTGAGEEGGYVENDVFSMYSCGEYECSCGLDSRAYAFYQAHPHAADCWVTKIDTLEGNAYRNGVIDVEIETERYVNEYAPREVALALKYDCTTCTCGVDRIHRKWNSLYEFSHESDCAIYRSNFRCGNVEIRWYKHIGRSLEIAGASSAEELRETFKKCLASLL